MDRNCDAFIRSNNTYDILIARESLEISDDRAECIQNIGEKFVAEYFDRDEVPQLSIKTYGYTVYGADRALDRCGLYLHY